MAPQQQGLVIALAADKQEESVRHRLLNSRVSTSPATASKQEERYTLVSLFSRFISCRDADQASKNS